MKYEEIIEIARSQPSDPHPGPDFGALMAAREAERPVRRRKVWMLAVAAVAAVAVVVVLGFEGMRAMLVRTSDPVEAVWSPSPPDSSGVVASRPTSDGADGVESVAVEEETGSSSTTEVPGESESESEGEGEGESESEGEGESESESESEGGAGRSRPRARASAEEIYADAEAKMARHDWAAARRALRRLTRTYPRHAVHGDALADLARIEVRLGRRQAAYCSYRRLLREHPSHPLAGSAATASRTLLDEGEVVDRCR